MARQKVIRSRLTVTVNRSDLEELRGHLEGATGWHWSNGRILNWCLFQTERALGHYTYKRGATNTDTAPVQEGMCRITVTLDSGVIGRIQQAVRQRFTGVNLPRTHLVQYAMRQAVIAWRSGDVTRYGMVKPQRLPDLVINDPSIVQMNPDDEPTLVAIHTHKRKPVKNGAM